MLLHLIIIKSCSDTDFLGIGKSFRWSESQTNVFDSKVSAESGKELETYFNSERWKVNTNKETVKFRGLRVCNGNK